MDTDSAAVEVVRSLSVPLSQAQKLKLFTTRLGLAAYAAGRSGSPLCRPDSLRQYHGAWHVLSAAAAGWPPGPWRRARR